MHCVQALAVVRYLLQDCNCDEHVVQALADFLQTPDAEHAEILSLEKCTGMLHIFCTAACEKRLSSNGSTVCLSFPAIPMIRHCFSLSNIAAEYSHRSYAALDHLGDLTVPCISSDDWVATQSQSIEIPSAGCKRCGHEGHRKGKIQSHSGRNACADCSSYDHAFRLLWHETKDQCDVTLLDALFIGLFHSPMQERPEASLFDCAGEGP